MSDAAALIAEALRLKAENPSWGYIKIGQAIGLHKDKVRRAIEHAERKKTSLPAVVEIEPRTASEYAERIAACWRKSVEAIFEVGRLLIAAKDRLPHGEFEAMIEANLPFGARAARMLMVVARDERLTNRKHASVLPPAWATLHELTKLDDSTFEARIADGTIRPDMERRDIAAGIKAVVRQQREATLGEMQARGNLALPEKRYGVILCDCEWRFEPWSRETGMDRSADNHYPTSVTEAIAARPVASIAADDCALFLWATAPMLPHALTVMAAWGFDYKSHIIAVKSRIGTGYWFRNEHELLLLGTQGNVPAPAPGTQWPSTRDFPVMRHSEKPDWQYELIEAYFPNLPRIELNARRARPGWDAWGLDAPSCAEAAE